jgi:hypothetical protein
MNNDKDEVHDLIKQLKNLQLQQTELLVRLERAGATKQEQASPTKKNPAPEK